MRFSTIISAMAVATSVTAAAGTSDVQPSLDSLNLDIAALHDLTGLVSATVIEDLEHVCYIREVMRGARPTNIAFITESS